MILPYLKQNCSITLKEGLEFHYGVNPTFKENTKKAPVFYNHDLAHVLFGLDTSVHNEALTDIRCISSTNWGLKKYIFDYFRDPASLEIIKSIMKEIGLLKSITQSFKSFPDMIRVYLDGRKMNKKWEIDPSEEVLNMKLVDLRKEYNITVIN